MAVAEIAQLSAQHRFDALLHALATIYEAEGRPGGSEAAAALRASLGHPLPPPGTALAIDNVMTRAFALATAHSVIGAGRDAADLITWHHFGLADGRIRPEIGLAMATAELIGPDGMIPNQSVRVGLFVQGPGLHYPTRTHAAEETFFVIAGTAAWQSAGAPAAPRRPGSYIFHPSGIPHASTTSAEPVLAAWRWSGDIAVETYALKG